MRYAIVISVLVMGYSPMIFAEERSQQNQVETSAGLPDLASDLVDEENQDGGEQQGGGIVQKNFNEVINDDTTLHGGTPEGEFGLTLESDF